MTWTVTPFEAAQAFATFVTAGTRSASAQITIFEAWLVADVPAEAATTATNAARARPATTRSLRVLNIDMPSLRTVLPQMKLFHLHETAPGSLTGFH
jgi:hypothetical protein